MLFRMHTRLLLDNRQIFHAFLFNIRNYSPEVIKLSRVNNFDIKQKSMEYLFYYMPPTLILTKHSKLWSKHKSFL